MGKIALVACADTKYHEIDYIKKLITNLSHTPFIVDISTGKNVPPIADYKREQVLADGGFHFEDISKVPKSEAIDAMSKSIVDAVVKLHSEGKIDAVLGFGGLQNTVICSSAFRKLPLGFPKVIVSTIACGNRVFDTVVGDKDIVVMPSIVDFAGLNPISNAVLKNAVAAVCGMVQNGVSKIDIGNEKLIATTLMGITNDTVMRVADMLAEDGKKVISFHSTGIGGKTMEQMIEDGLISATLDLTLHEMTAEYFGGYGYSKGADNRLCAGAKKGIPMLICPGGIDFICLRPDELFEDNEERGYSWHNSSLTHTKLHENEILDITNTIIERVNESTGPVTVVLPLLGLRSLSREGETFHIPETIKKMRVLFEEKLKKEIKFLPVNFNFMDDEFADILRDEMLLLTN